MLKYLPDHYMNRLLGTTPRATTLAVDLTITDRLKPFDLHNLEDKNTIVSLPLPDDFGTVDDELERAYVSYDARWESVDRLTQSPAPKLPSSFYCPIGWSYWDQLSQRWQPLVNLPSGKTFVLDAETVEVKPGIWHPTCMVAMSSLGWLVWKADLDKIDEVAVVPFTTGNDIIGYNVSYDRSYLDVEYRYQDSGNQFYDLMSMWIVTNGMSNQQRSIFASFAGDDDDTVDLSKPVWLQKTGTNGLASAYKFYTKKTLDKGVRDGIVDGGLAWVTDNMEAVIRYCALDVLATHELASHLLPAYKLHRPSKINRYGAVALGSCWVPLSAERFPSFYDRVESIYQKNKADLNELLMQASTGYLTANPNGDLQTASLDWTLAKSGKNKGLPKWYRDNLASYNKYKQLLTVVNGAEKGGLSLAQRWAPLVLGMTWGGSVVYWFDGFRADGKAIAHPTKRGQAVGNMFLKDFAGLYDSGFIQVADFVKSLVETKTASINWVSVRKRVATIRTQSPDGYPVTIPQMSVNGTVTGRATDPIWQVTANPKKNRIGTELKSMVAPFNGYSFVGADVNSQESWLSACHGDEDLGYCGSTPFSLMTVAGSSKDKTDIHSVVARETGYSRDITKTRVYGCVPMDTQALTKNGWKLYEDLKIGDLILAYNEANETNEWSAIEAMTYHENAELIKVSNGHNYEHISTPDHRWYTKQRHRYNRDEMVNVIRTTNTIRSESNIITSAYSVGGDSPVTPDEAAIIAWLITDGSVFWAKPTLKTSSSFGTKRGVQAMIVQKKEMQVSLLYSLLEPYLTKTVGFRSGTSTYTFRLKPQMVRDLWSKAGLVPEAEDYVSLVTNLTQPARKAFLEAFWLAEGHTDKSGAKHITQNIGSELESAIVAATLEGYGTRLVWKDSDRKCRGMRMIERKYVTGQRLVKQSVENASVWCPTTALGTWVMRQGDTITITGNCLYGQGVKGDSDVILRSNPALSEDTAKLDSGKFISLFKGKRVGGTGGCYEVAPSYKGGMASQAFTRMEFLADKKQPQTPLTGAYMSKALAGLQDYKPTRVNWIVQSSGVDFRDMLVLLTKSFYKRLGVDGRLIVTIHDELRSMVKDSDITKAVYALQLAHLYTRAAFIRAHKLDNIPAGIAYFSDVDVDSICLRKDSLDPQVTPTQTALPLGYTINPLQLLELLSC